MPSIRSVAIAAFAVFATAQAQFNNNTLPVASSSIGGWTYAGCYSVQANTGLLLDSSTFMTDERCTARCGAYAFARVQGNNCYCANDISGTTQVTEASCRTRCPGNPNQACGGLPGTSKRQLVGGAVTVYSRLAVVPAGSVYISVITNVYIDICPTCIGGVGPVTYCSLATLTGCGCPSQTTPAIAMRTVTTTIACATCPSSVSTVTLTVPASVTPGTVSAGVSTVTASAVVACATCPGGVTTSSICPGCVATTTAATAATTTKAVFTGAAENVKVGSGLLAGAAIIAALL